MKKIKRQMDNRKMTIFLIFLLCSFFAWFISELSDTYTQRTSFKLDYKEIPDSLMLVEASEDKVNVRLRARGFQLLAFNFKNKRIPLNLSKLTKDRDRYFISEDIVRSQIEQQLSEAIDLLEVNSESLYFVLQPVMTKEVPVHSQVDIFLGQNYLLDGSVKILPQTIEISGPTSEIDTIEELRTLDMELSEITKDFSTLVSIAEPVGLKHTKFSTKTIRVSGKVYRFSEKIIKVPVQVENIPNGTKIRTFPNTLSVLCKAKIANLKKLSANDFKVVADYNTFKKGDSTLEVKLHGTPKNVHIAQLLESEVDFILIRE